MGVRRRTLADLAPLAEQLQAAGAIGAGEPDPGDGRAKRVRLTDKGRAAWEALVQLSTEAEAEFAAAIGGAKPAQLRSLLERLAETLS